MNLGTDGTAVAGNKTSQSSNITLPKLDIDLDPKQMAELLKVGLQ